MKAKVQQPKVKTSAELTEADKIWNEVKDKQIEMFALPDQVVSMYVKPVTIDPSKLFLLSSASSVLPALELVLEKKFTVEKVDRFIVVTRK